MNGSLGTNQPGAYNSGTLGVVAQPKAYRSGSLGAAYRQPGSFNSGSLGAGYRQPGSYNSGSLGKSLGEYFSSAMQGLGLVAPEARNSGVLGEYYAASGLGCGCSPPSVSGLGMTVRYLGRPMKGLGQALGSLSLDTDTLFFTAIGAAAVFFVAKKK